MNLYQLIPIRCRPVDEDLSDSERSKYRLRLRKTLTDGNEYFLYYLKVLNFDEGVRFKSVNTSTGAEDTYELSTEYLDPKPKKPNTNVTIETSATSIVAYCEANVEISGKEVLEYINVAYNGDTRYAKISEIGFFTGIDREVPGSVVSNNQSVAINYTEACYTQLYNHATWLGTALSSEDMTIQSTFQITSNGSIAEA